MSEQKLVTDAAPERPLLPQQPEVNIGTAGHVDHGKCLTPDNYVLFNGVVRTGREIIDEARRHGTILKNTTGEEVYRLPGSTVKSIGSDLRPTDAECSIYVQDYHGPVYRVETKSGRKLTLSPEHPLLCNRAGVLTWVKAKDLHEGDYVTFESLVELPESVEFPSPFPHLRRHRRVVTSVEYQRLERQTEGWTNFHALNGHGFDSVRICHGMSRSKLAYAIRADPQRLNQILERGDVKAADMARLSATFQHTSPLHLASDEFLVEDLKGRSITKLREARLGEELAKWFAFVWAEGTSDRHRVAVAQKEESKMLGEFLGISERLFGVRFVQVSPIDYHLNSTAFVDYLESKFSFKPGSKTQSPIEPWVMRMPRNLKSVFLRWFLTLDGGFSESSGQVAIAQLSERSITTISYLLSSFGIVHHFDTIRRRLKRGMETYFRLSISGRDNLRVFAKEVGFENPSKQEKLLSYLARVAKASKASDFSFPVDARSLAAVLYDSGLMQEGFRPDARRRPIKSSSWYKAYEGARRTGRISRPKLLEVIEAVDKQLGLVTESAENLESRSNRVREHARLAGISLERMAHELGVSRKRLTTMLASGDEARTSKLAARLRHISHERVRRCEVALAQLRSVARSTLLFDPVRLVEETRHSGEIFDLTVPKHSNFLAGRGAVVCHNTTTTQAITGVWASAHSEELRRGITIKVGYADAAFYKCPHTPVPEAFSTSPKCPVCGKATKLLRAVSFVDCPGHESLMTNMLAGAFLMDGALLVIAANEPVPKPQTREHLLALQMLGMKKIVIAQNKVDLVTDEEAKKNYEAISKFVANTVAADAPIIPISAQQRLNIDALIEAIEDVIPTPKRDPKADPLMYVVRSFDVNKPGMEVKSLSGGVLGGSLVRGELSEGEEIELRPGMIDERSGKYVPIVTKVSSLQTGAGATGKVGPGGLVAVGTHLDPSFTKGDQMVGSVIGKPGTLPPVWEHVTLDVELFDTAVGSTELVKVDKVRPGEGLRLNLGTASTPATVTSARGDVIEVDLKKPVSVEAGMRAALNRRIAERWRLIGSGTLK